MDDDKFGLATLDMSSGQLLITEVSSQGELFSELDRLSPSELLIPEHSGKQIVLQSAVIRERPPWEFDLENSHRILNKQFGTSELIYQIYARHMTTSEDIVPCSLIF